MLRPQRRSLIDFQRPPIDAASMERIGLMRERMDRNAAFRTRERARLAREQEAAEILRLQWNEEALRRTRGDTDPLLLELADLGFIPDPDEIDAEFGALFGGQKRPEEADDGEHAFVERLEDILDPAGSRSLELQLEDLLEKDPETRQLLQLASGELSPEIFGGSGADRLFGDGGTDRLVGGFGRDLNLHEQTGYHWWLLAAAGRVLWEAAKRFARKLGPKKDPDKDQQNPSNQTPTGPRRPDRPDGLDNEEPGDADTEPLVPWDRGETKPQENSSTPSRQRLDAFAERVGASPERSIQASDANRETEEGLRESGKLTELDEFQPAHDPDGTVYEMETNTDFNRFVRLVREDQKNAPAGEFLIPKEEYDTITASPGGLEKLMDMYAIPEQKTHISEVTLPPGVEVRISNAAGNDFGSGGGIQVEIMDDLSRKWFDDARPVGD